MGIRRNVHLRAQHNEPDDFDMEIDFGTYVLMFYYAKQINYDKAKLLYDATLSEYCYRIDYNLSLGGLTYDDEECHFDADEFQQAMAFAENELIPALNNEEKDLIEKYGGKEAFCNKFNEDYGFIEAELYDERYNSSPFGISMIFGQLKVLLSSTILINKAYHVYIY